MKTVSLLIPVAAAGLILSAETAHGQGFTGPYAPANWTFTNNGGSGSLTTHNATTLAFMGDNGGAAGGQNTDITVVSAHNGFMTFDWTWAPTDSGTWDSVGYLKNGVYTALANNAGPFAGSVTGATIPIAIGDVIGFRIFSADGAIGTGTYTITNFAVPTPGALALLGLAGVAGVRRRRRA